MSDAESKPLPPDPNTFRQVNSFDRPGRTAPIPKQIRQEVTQFVRSLKKRYRHLFSIDPELKGRIVRLLRSMLPPKPRRRGRPGFQSVTIAIRLLRKFRRQSPDERAAKIWQRIYPQVIPGFASMPELEQGDARQQLQERVRWRLRTRKRRQVRK